MAGRRKATSRDPEEYARATEAARQTREEVAHEVAGVIAEQVEALIVEGDIMGGRALLASRLKALAVAERRGDSTVVRAALMDVAVASGVWVASIDFVPPSELHGSSNGSASVA